MNNLQKPKVITMQNRFEHLSSFACKTVQLKPNQSSWIALFALLALFAFEAYGYQMPSHQKMPPSANTEFLNRVSQGVADIAQYASQSIVFVSVAKPSTPMQFGEIDPFEFFLSPQFNPKTPKDPKQKGLGSGFFIDVSKGYIITNNHVIEGAEEILLKLANGLSYKGKVIGTDANTDVAVVEINNRAFNRQGVRALSWGNSDLLKSGEFVLVLGAPFGLESSISFGILSARERGNLNITTLGNFLQTDAAINPGNSGGPLLNSLGDIVGMNTAIYSRSGSSAGIGFAVPSNIVRQIALQLINHGTVARGYLGVNLQTIDEELAAGLGYPEDTLGVVVSRVHSGTPAAQAGLKNGDLIVTIGDQVISSPTDLTNAIGILPPGTEVKITYIRNNIQKTTSVRLAPFPKNDALVSKQEGESNLSVGLRLIDLNTPTDSVVTLRSQYQIESKEGLVVASVAVGSLAEQAGLREGDVLLKINNKKIKTIKEFYETFHSSPKLLIHLERRGNFLFASIRK